MAIRALMIDDDAELISLLGEYLARFDVALESANDAETGIRALSERRPDIVILDVMMGGIDGFEACRRIRKECDVPILMLSARGETTDRIVGLELGADDYMAKPFEPRELVTRMQAILRRAGRSGGGESLRFSDVEIRPAERDAFRGGAPLGLTSMEFDLLHALASSPNRKFSRDELVSLLQGSESESFGRSIDTLVSRLRAKISDTPRNPRFIKSSRGFGYVFIGDGR